MIIQSLQFVDIKGEPDSYEPENVFIEYDEESEEIKEFIAPVEDFLDFLVKNELDGYTERASYWSSEVDDQFDNESVGSITSKKVKRIEFNELKYSLDDAVIIMFLKEKLK